MLMGDSQKTCQHLKIVEMDKSFSFFCFHCGMNLIILRLFLIVLNYAKT